MKHKKLRFKEVWSVELRASEPRHNGEAVTKSKVVNVFAASAAQAEKKALALEKYRPEKERYEKPVCYGAKFEMNVEE